MQPVLKKIDWFDKPHEVVYGYENFMNYPAIKNYIDVIENGQPASEEMLLLINYLKERVFVRDDIYLDVTMTNASLAVPAKYFPYGLYDWEAFQMPFIFGFRFEEDNTLVFDEFFDYLARGAGKNGFMSWVIFFMLSKAHNIPNYDIVVSASSERQAKRSFTDIYEVLSNNSALSKAFKFTKELIENKGTKSTFQFLSSNGKTADGLRLGALYLDEIHAIAEYAMLNVLKSGLGKIPDARAFITTTDGYTRGKVLDDYKDRSKRILNGELGIDFPFDDLRHIRMFPFMCKVDSLEEATSEAMWIKANPSIKYNRFLLNQYRKEVVQIDSNAELNIEFHCKRVNVPKEDSRFSLATYDELQKTKLRPFEYYFNEYGQNEVVGVVDFSTSRDLTSVGLLGYYEPMDEYYYTQESFITNIQKTQGSINPEIIAAGERENKLHTVYNEIIEAQNVVDYFVQQANTYYIKVVFIDQYKASILRPALELAGFTVELINSNMLSETLVSPILDKIFTQNLLFVGEDSLFRWAVGNIFKNVVSKGVKFDKIEPKTRKTDPCSALITGLIGMLNDDIKPPQMAFYGKVIQ